MSDFTSAYSSFSFFQSTQKSLDPTSDFHRAMKASRFACREDFSSLPTCLRLQSDCTWLRTFCWVCHWQRICGTLLKKLFSLRAFFKAFSLSVTMRYGGGRLKSSCQI